jgi:hypothetical protein
MLRRLVKDSGLSFHRLGAELDVPPPVLWRFQIGRRKHLRSDTVDKLMNYFDLEVVQRRKGGGR